MSDPLDLDTMRRAAQAPATSPLVARLQAMIRALLPLHEAANAVPTAGVAADDAEQITAFCDGYEGKWRNRHPGAPGLDRVCVAEGLRRVRGMRD